MKTKKKIDKTFIYILLGLFIISITSIYSFSKFISEDINYLIMKQSIYYLISFFIIYLLNKFNMKTILKYSNLIYIINVILLFLLLIFAKEINGSKAWFNIPIFGTLQPSEFMKIGLILCIAKTISDNQNKKDIILILKIGLITLIPAILTFLEPDTGAVLVYFIIALIMLYLSGIKNIWFILLFTLIAICFGTLLYLYYNNQDLFIKTFGSNFFYRLDRLFDWKTSSGYQLENSIIAIGSSSIFGNGANNILLYFPEGHTDFIFTSFASIFGLFGITILLSTLLYLDLKIINLIKEIKDKTYKYILIGILSVLMYQQIQNIAMTIGLLPITGITLPFISYGGSSLLSFSILLGLVINISKEKRV